MAPSSKVLPCVQTPLVHGLCSLSDSVGKAWLQWETPISTTLPAPLTQSRFLDSTPPESHGSVHCDHAWSIQQKCGSVMIDFWSAISAQSIFFSLFDRGINYPTDPFYQRYVSIFFPVMWGAEDKLSFFFMRCILQPNGANSLASLCEKNDFFFNSEICFIFRLLLEDMMITAHFGEKSSLN